MKEEINGVYALFDGNKCVYIGQSNNCMRRIGEHFGDTEKEFDSYEVFDLTENISKKDKDYIEEYLIKEITPKYNVQHAYRSIYRLITDLPFKNKNDVVAYIDMTIKKIQLMFQLEEEGHYVKTYKNSKEEYETKYMQKAYLTECVQKDIRFLCSCKNCAYYFDNQEHIADEEITEYTKEYRYALRCPMKKHTYPDDGCTRGMPLQFDKAYTSQFMLYLKDITDKHNRVFSKKMLVEGNIERP